jgi:hypothetical protein
MRNSSNARLAARQLLGALDDARNAKAKSRQSPNDAIGGQVFGLRVISM